MTVEWKQGWPRELRCLIDQVVAKLHVDSLYYEGEISGLSGARTFRARADMLEGGQIVFDLDGVLLAR